MKNIEYHGKLKDIFTKVIESYTNEAIKLKKLLAAAVISAFVTPAIADVAVVTAKDSVDIPTTAIKRIFMGKKQSIDGASLEAVFQKPDSKVRQKFDFVVLNNSPSRIDSGWARMQFSGKADYTPQVQSGDAAVIDYVSGAPNRVGYVDSSAVTDSVKVIETFAID